MKWAVRVSLVGGKLTVKRPLGRPKLSWENNIKINIQEGGWLELTGLLWPRIRRCGVAVVNAVKNHRVH